MGFVFLHITTVLSPTRSARVYGGPAGCLARAGPQASAQISPPRGGRGGGGTDSGRGSAGGEGHSVRRLVDSGFTRRGLLRGWGIRGVLAMSQGGEVGLAFPQTGWSCMQGPGSRTDGAGGSRDPPCPSQVGSSLLCGFMKPATLGWGGGGATRVIECHCILMLSYMLLNP